MPDTFGTPVYTADGVVAAPHYLASLAGANVLRDGGSALDAALAANMVMAVVSPQMCGPGGDLFAQVWSSADRKLYGLNASGRAGSGMSVAAYRAQGLTACLSAAHGPSRYLAPWTAGSACTAIRPSRDAA